MRFQPILTLAGTLFPVILPNFNTSNEITIHSDRVEIYNPGTFPDGLMPQDFIKGERSIKRNPLLAQLMYFAKDIESFGTGLKRITEACDAAGVKVDLQMLKMGFAVVFYRPDEFDRAAKTSDVQINVQLNQTEQQVLALIAENPRLTLSEVAENISKTSKTAQRCLDSLKKKGIINRVGAKKDGFWEIKG